MAEELWKRFRRAWDSKQNGGSACHCCQFGEEFEYLEKLRYSPELYRNWPNYRDGCLVQKGYRPKADSEQCQMCFEGWVEEKKNEGKICVKCDGWVTKPGLTIEATSEYEDGFEIKTRSAVCENCLLQGRTVDEWAADIVKQAKERREELS